MSNELQTQQQNEVLQKLVLAGDLSQMTPDQKVSYYKQFCDSLGLNPLTEPFAILKLNGKEKLYAKKDASDQLRQVHGVSIVELSTEETRGVFIVTAKAKDRNGKTDASTGIVSIEGLKGEALANAMMKAETKAKRRVTLSICGLGMLDETEVRDIPNADVVSTTIGKKLPAATEKQMKDIEKRLRADGSDLNAIMDKATAALSFDDQQAEYLTTVVNEVYTSRQVVPA